MGNLVVQPLHGGLQGFQLLLQAGTLLHQNILAGCFGAFLKEQVDVVDEGFYLHPGTTHTFGKFYPATGGLVKKDIDMKVSKLPWRCSVILPECFVKIAAIAIPKHSGNFFYGKFGVRNQEFGPLHAFFQQQFRKGLADLLGQEPGDIDRVIAEMTGGALQCG